MSRRRRPFGRRTTAPAAVVPHAIAPLTDQPGAWREQFYAALGGGSVHAGAAVGRLFADWSAQLTDPRDDHDGDGQILAARAWSLVRDDAHCQALLTTLVRLVYGSSGFTWRSLFQADRQPDTTADEEAVRTDLECLVERASTGTRLDVDGQLTRRDLGARMLRSCAAAGNGWAIRLWRPERLADGLPLATCWRVIADERVSTPDYEVKEEVRNGIALNPFGSPVAIYVRRQHPSVWAGDTAQWDRVPLRAKDGTRTVLHLWRPSEERPGALRGLSWFAPLIVLARNLNRLCEAFIVAKRTQACMPAVLKTSDPAALKDAARRGALFGPHLVWKPGMVAVTDTDNGVEFPAWQFQGQDYQAFIDVQLRAFGAAWGLPFQFVLQQLTEANLASAQVSLDQASITAEVVQDTCIAHVEQPIDETILREGVARGLVTVPAMADPDLLCRGRYLRPRRPDANKQRTREAAKLALELGLSRETVFAEMGYDHEDERRRRLREDRQIAADGKADDEGTETASDATDDDAVVDPADQPARE